MAVQPGWELAGGTLSGRLGSPHISTCNRVPLAPGPGSTSPPVTVEARTGQPPSCRLPGFPRRSGACELDCCGFCTLPELGTVEKLRILVVSAPHVAPVADSSKPHVPRASWATCSRSSLQGPLCATESVPAPAYGARCHFLPLCPAHGFVLCSPILSSAHSSPRR